MKHSFTTSIILLFAFFLTCCSENEDPEPEPLNLAYFEVSAITTTDISNNGDASDIAISFTTSSRRDAIEEYKVVVIKEARRSSFVDSDISQLTDMQVMKIETTESVYRFQLPSDFVDTDGDQIVENVPYQIGVQSIFDIDGGTNSTVRFSESFQFSLQEEVVVTLPISFGQYDGLDAITLDSKGNLFVSNYGGFVNNSGSGSEVYKITPYASLEIFADGFSAPNGIYADPQDNIFVSHSQGFLHKISSEGDKMLFASSVSDFGGLTMDDQGNLYSGSYVHDKILKITPNGEVEVIAEHPSLTGTTGLVYYAASDVLLAGNFDTGEIFVISMQGEIAELYDTSGVGYMTLMNDDLYVTLFNDHQIARISMDGEFTVIAGSSERSQSDGALLEASFIHPNGIVADSENNVLYISDWGSPRITKIFL